MKFDVYIPFYSKERQKMLPGLKAVPMTWEEAMSMMDDVQYIGILNDIADGKKELKTSLPSICFTGRTTTGKREDAEMEFTQLVMYDLDHVNNTTLASDQVYVAMRRDEALKNSVAIMHRTPSGGLRVVFKAQPQFKTLKENMEWFHETCGLGNYGDFDPSVHNVGRVSFLVHRSYVFYENEAILNADSLDGPLTKEVINAKAENEEPDKVQTPEEYEAELHAKYDDMEWKGIKVKTIIDKYVELHGSPKPGSGETHNYYNELVKNFRHLCNNNKDALITLLPRFGHGFDECYSQIKSITKVNSMSRFDKPFYFFLKDNGFYPETDTTSKETKEWMMNTAAKTTFEKPKYIPPVFKDFLDATPDDFWIPTVCALLPIMGTLTSYAKAVYPYDKREHTTSFFSVIYAPAATGKGFVERLMDALFTDLRLRDLVSSERENIYLRFLQRRGANDKAPDLPHVSLRIIPAKNSEAEFLQKQSDNKGYHMFTYSAEMDSWAKGVKAAGGNKDDMIRVAWDNGRYGQQFKSANTFKGEVNLFWNVLITGTLPQLMNYFKNVENGLVTRCSFCGIPNQEFSMPPKWREITKRGRDRIARFMQRCDSMTYKQPCTVTPDLLRTTTDENFDKEIDWRFEFQPKQLMDCSWIMPTIDAFHQEQIALAGKNVDTARDVFRKRVGVRGFRLALMCMCLWDNPTSKQLNDCKSFIDWWMHIDIENMLQLWGEKYNELQVEVKPSNIYYQHPFDALGDTFTKEDVYQQLMKRGLTSPVAQVIYHWKRLGLIKKEVGHFIKIKK